jgi:hypothetical protein
MMPIDEWLCPRPVGFIEHTKLRPDQAAYIGVPQSGPFKPDHYRY